MAIYTFDPQNLVGVEAIDNAHRNIGALSQNLKEAIDEGAAYEKVYETFQDLSKEMNEHFILEERLMETLGEDAGVSDHISRHKKNHKTFRDILAYAEGKFQENKMTKQIPNVIELIPEHYIEELKGLDTEMATYIKTT